MTNGRFVSLLMSLIGNVLLISFLCLVFTPRYDITPVRAFVRACLRCAVQIDEFMVSQNYRFF